MRLLTPLINRFRQGNGAYLLLALGARALNALGMFLAIRRFSPDAFGEMGYLQATAVSAVAFTSFGIDLSINAQLSRKRKQEGDVRPTLAAGVALAFCGICLVIVAIGVVFSSQLAVSGPHGLTVAVLSTFCSFMILTSLLNAVSFAFQSSVNVGIAYTMNALIFIAAAVFAPPSVTGTNLLMFLTIAQLLSAVFLGVSLAIRISGMPARNPQMASIFFAEARREVATLFKYGTKQIVIVSVVTFSQWLIQRKIVFGNGGSAENAIYSVGNQVFNIMTFIPTLLGPVIVSRLAAAEADTQRRRKICIASIKLFATIAVIACICTFFGLRVAVLFLPDRYLAAITTGTLAAVAAAFQIIKAPFSLYFLSELRASREIASSVTGAVFMIIATAMFAQLHPNAGTIIRLAGCALQAALLALFFGIESRSRSV